MRKIQSVVAEIFHFWYFEVIFHWWSSSFQEFVILVQFTKIEFTIWGGSDQWLLRYSTFNILRLSSIGGHLCFKHFLFWFGPLSSGLKFEKDLASGYWDIQFLIIWGRLLLEVVFISSIFNLVWSPELKFQIWGRSDQWLLKYSTFNILRSSSIDGRLPFKHFWFWFGPLSLSLKFEENPTSGCWYIQVLIFWGLLPLEVIFH